MYPVPHPTHLHAHTPPTCTLTRSHTLSALHPMHRPSHTPMCTPATPTPSHRGAEPEGGPFHEPQPAHRPSPSSWPQVMALVPALGHSLAWRCLVAPVPASGPLVDDMRSSRRCRRKHREERPFLGSLGPPQAATWNKSMQASSRLSPPQPAFRAKSDLHK